MTAGDAATTATAITTATATTTTTTTTTTAIAIAISPIVSETDATHILPHRLKVPLSTLLDPPVVGMPLHTRAVHAARATRRVKLLTAVQGPVKRLRPPPLRQERRDTGRDTVTGITAVATGPATDVAPALLALLQ
jgi:hypothetical protein